MSDVNDAMDELGERTKYVIGSDILEKLDHLKRTLHPEEKLKTVDQCAIVAEALSWGSPFEEDREGLSTYLDISVSQVYKMKAIHLQAIPEMREYLRVVDYKPHTAYTLASMSQESQKEYLDAEKTLDRGIYDTSDRTKIGDEG